jgi:type VI secretion system (T6SS) effector Hcp
MGARRRHTAEREPAQGRPRAVLQRAPEQETGVLALQRAAGNRAVAEQLQVARDDTAVPMDTETKQGHATLTLEGIGSFEIESFGWGSSTSPGTGGGGAGRAELTQVRIMATKRQLGSAVSTLAKAAADGQPIDKAELVQGSFKVQLRDVYIGSWQVGSGEDETVSFTLTFGSIHYGDEEKKKGAVDSGGAGFGGGPAGPWS